MQAYLCANRHHFAARRPACPYPGCTAEIRPTSFQPGTDGHPPKFSSLPRLSLPGDKGICEVCGQEVSITQQGFRRHKGKTEFDLATDGWCSGSYGYPAGAPAPSPEETAAPIGPEGRQGGSSGPGGAKHAIRWWAYVKGERTRRASTMKDGDFTWDATCALCGWDSGTGGQPMSSVDKMVQEHKS